MVPLQRVSLSDQVAARLREWIQAGRWTTELDSEGELGRGLGVSRVTLRKALARLVQEGLLAAGGRGRRHRIQRVATRAGFTDGRIVRVLSPYPITQLGAANHALLDKARERLGAAGYRLEFEHRPALFRARPAKELARLEAQPETAGWMLFYATEPIQRWFAARGRPCLVIGATYPQVDLPNVSLDAEATGRHAAGLFYRRGHRELVYLIADFTSHTDRECAAAFVAEATRLGARARVVSYPPEVPGLRRVLRETLAGRPRPTGLVASAPEHCLTILGHLQEAGLRVPADVSLVSITYDCFLSYTVPSIAHYEQEGARVGQQGAEILLDLLRHGPGKPTTVRILPEFKPGDTLGQAAKA